MKKFFTLIVLFAMIFLLVACEEDSGLGSIDISKLNSNSQIESTEEQADTKTEASTEIPTEAPTEPPTISKEFEDSEKIDSDIIQNQSECFLSKLTQGKKYKVFDDNKNEKDKIFNLRNDTNNFVIISWIDSTGSGGQEPLSPDGNFGIKIDNKIAFEYKIPTVDEIEALLNEKQENAQLKDNYQYIKVSALEFDKPIKSQNYKYIYNNMDFNVILEIDGSNQNIEKKSFYYYNLENKEFIIKRNNSGN